MFDFDKNITYHYVSVFTNNIFLFCYFNVNDPLKRIWNVMHDIPKFELKVGDNCSVFIVIVVFEKLFKHFL